MTENDPIVYRNTSDEWVAYRIDAIFRGIEHDIIELSPVDPPIDPSTIDFNYVEGLRDNFLLDLGAEKDLGGGITLRCAGIDMLDGTAWIELSKNGTVQYSHILQEIECATYEHSGMLHCCEVHRVFTGVGGNLVEFLPVKISDIDMASVPDRSEYIMVGRGELVELSGGAELLCKQIDLGGEAVAGSSPVMGGMPMSGLTHLHPQFLRSQRLLRLWCWDCWRSCMRGGGDTVKIRIWLRIGL